MIVETVKGGAALDAVRALWTEYWKSFGLPADFQGFAEELRSLPGKYAPPDGRLLLLCIGTEAVGTAAFRPLAGRACEAKRLYVRPAYRGRGAARRLMSALVEEARQCGYRHMFGDTLSAMSAALALYRELGFVEVGPYSADPTPGAVYLRLDL